MNNEDLKRLSDKLKRKPHRSEDGSISFSRYESTAEEREAASMEINDEISERVSEFRALHPDKDVFTCFEEVIKASPTLARAFTTANFDRWNDRIFGEQAYRPEMTPYIRGVA
jgi:hypothetical protein